MLPPITQLAAIEKPWPQPKIGKEVNVSQSQGKISSNKNPNVPRYARKASVSDYLTIGESALKIPAVREALECRTVDWDVKSLRYISEADVQNAAVKTYLAPIDTAFAAYVKVMDEEAEGNQQNVERKKDKHAAEDRQARFLTQFQYQKTDANNHKTATDMIYLENTQDHPDGQGTNRASLIVDYKSPGILKLTYLTGIFQVPAGGQTSFQGKIATLMIQADKYCKNHGCKKFAFNNGDELWLVDYREAYARRNPDPSKPNRVILGDSPYMLRLKVEDTPNISKIYLGFQISGWDDKWEVRDAHPAGLSDPEVGPPAADDHPRSGPNTRSRNTPAGTPTEHQRHSGLLSEVTNAGSSNTEHSTGNTNTSLGTTGRSGSSNFPLHGGPPEGTSKSTKKETQITGKDTKNEKAKAKKQPPKGGKK